MNYSDLFLKQFYKPYSWSYKNKTADWELFHTHLSEQDMLIVEDPSVTEM
jgi:hypothetical protein